MKRIVDLLVQTGSDEQATTAAAPYWPPTDLPALLRAALGFFSGNAE